MGTPTPANIDDVQAALEAASRIVKLTLQPLEPGAFMEKFAEEVVRALKAGCCTIWSLQGQELQMSASFEADKSAVANLALPEQTQVQTIANVFEQHKAVVFTGIEEGAGALEMNERTVQAIFVPLLLKDQGFGVMRVLTRGVWDPAMLRRMAARASALGIYINLYVDNRTLRLGASEETGFARLAQISATLHNETDRERLYLAMVNGIRDIIAVDRAAIGLASGGGTRVAAVSGVDKIQPKAALIQKIAGIMDDVAASGDGVCINQGIAGTKTFEGEQGRKLREYLEESKMTSLVGIPMKIADRTIGVLLLEKAEENAFTKRDLTLAEGYGAHAAIAAANIGRVRSRTLPDPVKKAIRSPIKIVLALAVLGVLGWVVFVHDIDRHIKAECRVVPRTYSIIARVGGLVTDVLTKEAARVKKDDALFMIDKQELALRLSETVHEIKANEQKVLNLMSARKLGEALSLKMDIEALKYRRNILEEKIGEATVRSPCDGMVLTPNLDQLKNSRVTIGQQLAWVADVSQLSLELYVGEADWELVEKDQQVLFYLKARPAEKGEPAVIRHLRVHSMDRNNRNVFVAEAALEQDFEHFRPGYEGEARILVGRTTIGAAVLRALRRKFAYRFF